MMQKKKKPTGKKVPSLCPQCKAADIKFKSMKKLERAGDALEKAMMESNDVPVGFKRRATNIVKTIRYMVAKGHVE